MRTLRDLRHMGRVLWVTFQEPRSQERVGGVTAEGVGEEEALEVVGWRREMGGGVVVVAAMVVALVVEMGRARCGVRGRGVLCVVAGAAVEGGASSWVVMKELCCEMCFV